MGSFRDQHARAYCSEMVRVPCEMLQYFLKCGKGVTNNDAPCSRNGGGFRCKGGGILCTPPSFNPYTVGGAHARVLI